MRSPKQSATEGAAGHDLPPERTFRKGDRVEVTKWTPHPRGRVTGVDRGSVFVKYNDSFVEDELDPGDVQAINPTGRRL